MSGSFGVDSQSRPASVDDELLTARQEIEAELRARQAWVVLDSHQYETRWEQEQSLMNSCLNTIH